MNSPRKFDSIPKLRGIWKYLDDYSLPGMLHGQLLYSTCHHGIIERITFPDYYDPDEFTIVSAKDIPGTNIVPEPVCDQPFLAEKEVMHYGQVILGIAHPDRRILIKFIKDIRIKYKELPALIDVKECLDNEENHFGREITIDHSTDELPDRNWIQNKSTFYTQHHEQAYLEPQGIIADYNPGMKSMFIRGTLQCPFFVKSGVEAIFGNSMNEVIVETSEGIGGAFGGKEDFPSLLAGITALLSFKSGKPVKTVLQRSDDIKITTKRHPSRITIETHTDPKTQKIMRCRVDYRLDAGAYQTLSPVVLARGVLHATGGYFIPDTVIRGRLFRSNTPSNGAFRGFGVPQALAAMESHIDRIAENFQVNPAEFRKSNLLTKGKELPTTQMIKENNLSDCLERVLEKSDYHRKKTEFEKWNRTHKDKKGIGISIGLHGGGFTGNGEKVLNSEIKIVIDRNADVEIFVANTDMGQGAHTTLSQMFYESLDHPSNKCRIVLPNTSKTPNSGPTVASRTIYIIGNLICKLALDVKAELGFNNLQEYVSSHIGEFPREFRDKFTPDPSVDFDEDSYQGTAYKDFSWAATVTEILFHKDTYHIEVIKSWSVLDIGKVVNHAIATGQAQGGILQGLAYATSEYFYKPGFGRLTGFTDYALPTAMDVPEIDVEFIHTDSNIPKGLGELPMDFPAPSVRNALHNATGILIDELPLIPERIQPLWSENRDS